MNPDLCNANAVLYQLSYEANWKLVTMWVNDKPVDVDIYDQINNLLLTEPSQVRTKTTEGQYSTVRLEQARLVSSLLYGTCLL